jgi:hypothetical protein
MANIVCAQNFFRQKRATPILQVTLLVNLSVRRRIGKNWLRSAMTISSGTFGVHSHKCLELDPAKYNITKKLATPNSPSTV